MLVKEKSQTDPQTWENTYFHWIDNLRDWCISRQLWWGHRIPIWYRVDNPDQMICYDGEGVPPEVSKDPMTGCKIPMSSTRGFHLLFGPLAHWAGRKTPTKKILS